MNGPDGYIHADPAVLCGKPVIRGTRLSIEFLRGLVDSGWTHQQVLDAYPRLTLPALQAMLHSGRDGVE